MPPTTPQTDEQVMTGGPDLTDGAPADSTTPPSQTAAGGGEPTQTNTTTPPAGSPAAPTPIFIGGRRFNSPEELAEYTSQLEMSRAQNAPQAPIVPPAEDEKQIADLFYEDPAAAIKIMEERAEARVMQKLDSRDARRSALQSFYDKNPDLKGLEDVVELTRVRIQDKLNRIPLEQAMKELADATRGRLSDIRGRPRDGKEVPPGPARMASSSNGPGAMGAPAPVVSKSFVQQMAELRKKRSK